MSDWPVYVAGVATGFGVTTVVLGVLTDVLDVWWHVLKTPWRRWYESGFADGASEALGQASKELEDTPGADAVRARLLSRKARIDLDIKKGQAEYARRKENQ